MDDAFFQTPERSFGFAFHGFPLDRVAERRDDAAFLASLSQHGDAQVLLIGRDMPILKRDESRAILFPHAELAALGGAQFEALLGLDERGAPVFAARLPDDAVEQREDHSDGFLDRRILVLPGRDDLELVDLRSLAMQGLVTTEALALLGTAKAVLDWHARHAFCANCGHPTRVTAAGWRRECDACKTQHFPRTDPVVIMLAIDGDRCLLGRQRRFPKGMYSALAGFVEPGETIEEAVRREILEESGIETGRVKYVASQPWPFPSTLMIGCFALARSSAIRIDEQELEDARWFDREEVRSMFEKRHPEALLAPNRMAIAHHLVKYWLDGEV
jgi:NAD+ diphosphatase